MEYYQKLTSYFQSQGLGPEASAYYGKVAYMQAQQQAMQAVQAPTGDQQAMIQQFMKLNDGQKMQFAQNWLLQNPQYFMKPKTTTA